MNILYSWMTIAWNWHFPTPRVGGGARSSAVGGGQWNA